MLREVEASPIFKSLISPRLKPESRAVTTDYSLKNMLTIHEQVFGQLQIAISKLPLEEESILEHSVSKFVTDSALEPILPTTASNHLISYLIEEEILTNEILEVEESLVAPVEITPRAKLAVVKVPAEEIMEEVREEVKAEEIAEQVTTKVYEELLQQDISVKLVTELPIKEQLKKTMEVVEVEFTAMAILEEGLNEGLQLKTRNPQKF